MRLIRPTLDWLDARLRVGAAIRETAAHPVPRRSASWWYVFGSGAFTLFLLQIVTGICLALVYVPSAGEAYRSLQILNYEQPLGWFLRAMHGWGSNFMVAMVLIHMVQVFLFGAYKFPRELTWMVGVVLLVATLGMAFSGQVLRWDQDAYWGLGIVASIVGRIPLLGGQLVQVVLGGPIIAGETLTRFFALHVFVIPGLLIALVGVHLLMVLKLGINEYPMPGRLVNKDTYLAEYEEMVHEGRRALRAGRVPEGPGLRRDPDLRGDGLRRGLRSVRSRRARRIPPSSRRCRGRTTSSSGSSRSPR